MREYVLHSCYSKNESNRQVTEHIDFHEFSGRRIFLQKGMISLCRCLQYVTTLLVAVFDFMLLRLVYIFPFYTHS